MTWWLDGWTGDNAGPVQGREFYRAFVRVVVDGPQQPQQFCKKTTTVGGIKYHSDMWAAFLGGLPVYALVTDVKFLAGWSMSLEVTPVGTGHQKVELTPGVHLVAISAFEQIMTSPTSGWNHRTTTFASVIVPEKARLRKPPINLSGENLHALWTDSQNTLFGATIVE